MPTFSLKPQTVKPQAVLRANYWRALPFMALILVALSLLFAEASFAQQITGLPTMDELSSTDNQSTAGKIFASMFGEEFANNPLLQVGAATGLLGSIFFVFNGALFVVGTAFILYNTIMMIAVSAHKGEVLGERMSSLWIPIRLGTGIFGMAPVFMGFSLAQAVMFMIAILGNNLGDMMARKAVELNDAFSVIVPAPGLSDTQAPIMIDDKIGDALFSMHACHKVYFKHRHEMEGNDGVISRAWANAKQNVRSITGFFTRGTSDPTVLVGEDGSIRVAGAGIDCGGTQVENASLRSDTDINGRLGFRNSAVRYDEINRSALEIYEARKRILFDLNDKVERLASDWALNFVEGKKGEEKPYPAVELKNLIDAAVQKEQVETKRIMDAMASSETGTISQEAKRQMIDGGWMTLGSWYSIFAESNAAIQSASTAFQINPMPMDFVTDKLPKEIDLAFKKLAQQKRDIEIGGSLCPGGENATGNCSPGQNLLLVALETSVGGTGGFEMVNPIIASKNLGDWMLVAGGTVLIIEKASGLIDKIPVVGGLAAKITRTVGSAVASSVIAGFEGTAIWGPMLMIFLVMGIVLAVWIPMVPFITWFTASISYFASVVEGMVAAQVWAFSHLHTDGEGMGQRAEKGYLYMLNMLLRPALMVIGFFFASSIVVLMGTFFYQQIGPAVANLQGNTATGPLIMFGLLALFAITTLSLIQTIFNMVYEIPDRVIAWFGHGMEARMAKEMDKDVEHKMGRAASWMGGALLAKDAVKGVNQRGRPPRVQGQGGQSQTPS